MACVDAYGMRQKMIRSGGRVKKKPRALKDIILLLTMSHFSERDCMDSGPKNKAIGHLKYPKPLSNGGPWLLE